MTAIALAESGGESGAHNSRGEDSRGLWQINVAAHPKLGRRDLYDPLENAKAAFRVSGEGRDVSPWTTTHGDSDARYIAYRSEAQAAAHASGDPAGGVWTGTPGYGHPLAADGAGQGGSDALRTFLDSALAQSDDPYVWGAEAWARDGDPDAFDCSELVQWAAQRAGVELPDGSWLQYLKLDRQGATIPVEQALRTPGALLFSFSREPTAGGGRPSRAHVAISLGDGRTIEAQSPRSGVGSWRAGDRFQYAAVIPGISDGTAGQPSAQLATASAVADGHDSDRDGVTDAMEARLGLSSTAADTDHDNVSDGYELLKLRTNPTLADTDRDRLLDSLELALGTDPLNPDSDRDGRVDGARNRPDGAADEDRDGVTDVLERILGSNPKNADSDRDGFVDGAEYRSSFDPTEAESNPLADAQGGASGRQRAVESPDTEQSWGLDDLGAH